MPEKLIIYKLEETTVEITFEHANKQEIQRLLCFIWFLTRNLRIP